MIKSPSLFFDILTEDDETKRDEKIKRASFEIKTQLATIPSGKCTLSLPLGSIYQQQQVPHGTADSAASLDTPSIVRAANTADAPASNGHLWVGTAAEKLLHQSVGSTGPNTPGAQQPMQQLAASAEFAAQQQQQLQQRTAPFLQQQQQQQQEQPTEQLPQQVMLTPQEVLQELLGDLYIHQSRLIMGDLVGQGGFADVHSAELVDPVLGFREAVAVKRLRPDALKGPDDLKEFLTEANLLRKLAHRNIVQLRGVGASELTDLVTMRESMFVVQEFMAGGDLKQLVVSAMARPFDPEYSKSDAVSWAMQVAEAMHYLHHVCRPMIIHRDLKLENILLTGGPIDKKTAKLADFGLHKRVRKLVSSGALVAWNQETTYHGVDYERSYYGGNVYMVRSAMSVASSWRDDASIPGSVGGSMHGGPGVAGNSINGRSTAAAALERSSNGALTGAALPVKFATADNSSNNTSSSGGAGSGRGSAAGAVVVAAAPGSSSGGCVPGQSDSGKYRKPPLYPSTEGQASRNSIPKAASEGALGSLVGADGVAGTQPFDLAQVDSAALSRHSQQQQQQQQQQQLPGLPRMAPPSPALLAQQQQLLSAVRAKSQGLLGKQEFVTRVLTASARPELLQDPGGLLQQDKDVSRTFAAVQALEGSVRAGNAFYQGGQQQRPGSANSASAVSITRTGSGSIGHTTAQQPGDNEIAPAAAAAQHSAASRSVADSRASAGASNSNNHNTAGPKQRQRQQQKRGAQSELDPQLLLQLQAGLAAEPDSQKFIEATQKVGSLLYMAPEVLTGHQYNEKVDVFGFGIILYELLSGVVVAGRVAMAGQHEELLDYARQVANGHREALPSNWPGPVKHLISSCWAQDPAKRPGFKEILRQLYHIKQSDVDVEMDKLRPRGNYNPVTDCGCNIM